MKEPQARTTEEAYSQSDLFENIRDSWLSLGRHPPCGSQWNVPSSASVLALKVLRFGWQLARAKGSHHQFKKAGVALIVTVPHPERDIPTGTLRNIFRCAGWDWK
jgi:predicted RNA binding protein YcfA (HicA-like mRNA interferase family)